MKILEKFIHLSALLGIVCCFPLNVYFLKLISKSSHREKGRKTDQFLANTGQFDYRTKIMLDSNSGDNLTSEQNFQTIQPAIIRTGQFLANLGRYGYRGKK